MFIYLNWLVKYCFVLYSEGQLPVLRDINLPWRSDVTLRKVRLKPLLLDKSVDVCLVNSTYVEEIRI